MAKKEVSGKVFERVFLPWTGVLILLHLVTIYIASAYMWGVHFYHFFPAWIGWALTLASLALLIPSVGYFLSVKSEKLAGRIKRPFSALGESKTFLILSILSLPVFWIFRTRLHLLGDGYFRIRDLPAGKLHLQEWLDGFTHLVVYRIMHNLNASWTPELTYSVISILCGGMFVFLALKLSSFLGKTGVGKVLIFFFLVSLGSVQLFFGYVESYSILQVALLGYIWLAARYLSGKSGIFPAVLLFVLSIGLHVTSLIYLPSLIYLVTRKRRVGRREEASRTKAGSSTYILAGLILVLVFAIFWVIKVATGLEEAGKGIFLLPLVGTESYSFGMFSLGHISEFVNQLLLLSPLGISLVIFFIFFKIISKDFEDRLVNFLIIAAGFGLIYLFAFNFTLGSADWDLRSSPAPFIGLLGVILFVRWGEQPFKTLSRKTNSSEGEKREPKESAGAGSSARQRFQTWGMIFVWLGLFHTVPWILTNASHSRSVARYVLIQEQDPHPVDETEYNLYKIARILRLAEVPEEVEKLYLRAIERNPFDTLSYFNLAAFYHKNEFLEKAIATLDTLLKVDPLYPKANWMMGNVYVKKKEYDKALPYLERVAPVLADNPDFLYDLGVSYYSTGQIDKALLRSRQILELTPDYADAYHILGFCYVKLEEFEKAKQAWQQLLILNPTDSIAVYNLKELEKHLGESRPP